MPNCGMTPCCSARLESYLRSAGGRLTSERTVLLQYMCKMEGHFSPENLQARMVETGTSIALTTIYRNIPVLLGAGIIRRASIYEESGSTTYEHVWGRDHHDHLVCSECGRRVEFHYPALEVLQEAVAKERGFSVTTHHLEIVGICPECRSDDRQENS